MTTKRVPLFIESGAGIEWTAMRPWPRLFPQNVVDLRADLARKQITVAEFMQGTLYKHNVAKMPWLAEIAAYRNDAKDQEVRRYFRNLGRRARYAEKKAAAALTPPVSAALTPGCTTTRAQNGASTTTRAQQSGR